jgi:hypothetical protein
MRIFNISLKSAKKDNFTSLQNIIKKSFPFYNLKKYNQHGYSFN